MTLKWKEIVGWIIAMFVFSPAILGSFLLIYVISLPFIILYNRLSKNFEKANKRWQSLPWLILLVIICFGIFRIDNSFAKKKMGKIITACEQYNEKYKFYPNDLKSLVPEFLPSIPQARLIGFFNGFYYMSRPDSHNLFYMYIPPYGRLFYNFEKKKYLYLD